MQTVHFGEFAFDRHTLELWRDGVAVKLQQQPARVLAVLTLRPGELVTREELRKAVWADDTFVDFDRGLNYCISHIRTALGESAEAPRFLETLRGRGYRFNGVVEAPPAEAPPSPRRRVGLLVAAATLVVALAGLAVWAQSRRAASAIGVAALEAPASEREWAAAMHAQIVSRLSAALHIPVVDLTRVSRRTRWRVEGRVDRSPQLYRVTVLLRDTRDGSVPWSDIFSGTPGDWVDAQSEMAQHITEIIRYRLEGPREGLPRRRQKLPPNRSLATP